MHTRDGLLLAFVSHVPALIWLLFFFACFVGFVVRHCFYDSLVGHRSSRLPPLPPSEKKYIIADVCFYSTRLAGRLVFRRGRLPSANDGLEKKRRPPARRCIIASRLVVIVLTVAVPSLGLLRSIISAGLARGLTFARSISPLVESIRRYRTERRNATQHKSGTN